MNLDYAERGITKLKDLFVLNYIPHSEIFPVYLTMQIYRCLYYSKPTPKAAFSIINIFPFILERTH